MARFYCCVFLLTFLTICKEISSLPFPTSNDEPVPIMRPLHMFMPKTDFVRQRRDEEGPAEGEQSIGSGVQEFITTAIKDAIAASSAIDSPTMFIGGFSVMMQPMPNGTEFSGQLMQMAPHYMSLLPALPTVGRK